MQQLFVGATVIDGTGAAPQRDAAVLVNGARIEAVGTASRTDQTARRRGHRVLRPDAAPRFDRLP